MEDVTVASVSAAQLTELREEAALLVANKVKDIAEQQGEQVLTLLESGRQAAPAPSPIQTSGLLINTKA